MREISKFKDKANVLPMWIDMTYIYIYLLGLVFEVENLNEVTSVHQEQIFNLQNTDEQLDERITNLENNGSGSSNTTGYNVCATTHISFNDETAAD